MWRGYNWGKVVKSEGPSLKLWWIITDTRKSRRWVVKNLKAFVDKHYPEINENTERAINENTERAWWAQDKRYFYDELARHGRSYLGWRAEKPMYHKWLYNLLGSANLKLYKGAYEKKVPYDEKEFKTLCETGISRNIKQFWGDIDFTI